MRGYVVEYYVGNTGYIQYRSKSTDEVTVYTKKESAKRQRRRILRHGTPNVFSGCGRTYSDSVIIREVTIR